MTRLRGTSTVDRACRLAWLALGLVAVVGPPRWARAQSDFFRVSPGPLSASHAKWDNGEGCPKCHELGKGVSNLLCLECHAHQPLKRAIAAKEGLHATFREPCVRCHPEHKGRAAAIDKWDALGGRSNFNHERTGFTLAGFHAKVQCASCHKRTLASGRISYVGLEPECLSCHKNPHAFTSEQARAHACTQCHVPGVAGKMRGINVPFPHAKESGVALTGQHARALCVACHKNAQMGGGGQPRTCKDCHKTPHGPSFTDKPCARCHAPDRPWKKASFDHEATKFPLRAKHAKIPCERCHRTPKSKPDRTCTACHEDLHKGRFGKRPCEQCHTSGDRSASAFDHTATTKMPLLGKHAKAGCRDCHRGKKPADFEKFATPDCGSCHRHTDAHAGQLRDKPCTACHGRGGGAEMTFDHSRDARFAVAGLHLRLAKNDRCGKCHPKKQWRTGKVRCVDCHKDSHKGTLGEACDKCHTTEVKFAKIVFDHTTQSRFPLTGKHLEAKCEKCHPERVYKRQDIRCVVCHGGKDPHQRKLGEDCARCHRPEPGAPLFDHDRMTKFARTGRHLQTACPVCHQAPLAAPPPVGWTAGLTPAEKVDRLFPVMGRTCAQCHRDPHAGRYGAACGSCHENASFKNVARAVHDTGAFRLGGAHDELPCGQCHRDQRLVAGSGDLCQSCHWDDDIHHGALGPTCGECHGQREWALVSFSHAETGFPLRGAHRLASCRGCHGMGTYAGVPTDCEPCHLRDAARARDPLHTGELSECADCHREVSFVPARQHHPTYALQGAHVTLRCRDCHGSGTYLGTPTDCAGCHLAAYLDPATTPNHATAGFSLDCDECHNQTAWTPALDPRTP